MHIIRNAWDIVSAKTISNCYKKCRLTNEADNFPEEIPVKEEEMDENFLRYLAIDDNLETSGDKSDSEIATGIVDSKVVPNQEVEESDSEKNSVPNLPSSMEVRKALDVLRRTLEQRGGNTENYRNFYKLSNDVERLISNSATQTTIHQFFTTIG